MVAQLPSQVLRACASVQEEKRLLPYVRVVLAAFTNSQTIVYQTQQNTKFENCFKRSGIWFPCVQHCVLPQFFVTLFSHVFTGVGHSHVECYST